VSAANETALIVRRRIVQCKNYLANEPAAHRLPHVFRTRGALLLGPSAPFKTYRSFKEFNMVNFIVWLVIGGLIGWVASMIMRTDGQQGVFLNVVVGIVGAAIGGWLISPLVGVPTINQDAFSIGALVVSLIGAIILLAIVNLFRRGRAR
jgi:uncharacterized membrane protein YeaQ/YmgE (transglycosylase-associated protein family)